MAVSTDTGCFRYSNTTARTLRVAATCLEAGAESYPINKRLFETTRLCRLRLNAYLAQHLELLQGGKIALCPIPLEVERETGVTEDDLSLIHILSIERFNDIKEGDVFECFAMEEIKQ